MIPFIDHYFDEILRVIGGVFLFFYIFQYLISTASAKGYASAGTLLTKAELNFFTQLKRHIPNSFVINSKVRLADIVLPKKGKLELLHKVQAKHVDFVLTELSTSKIICAIELDDSSHLSTSAFKRDSEKNNALKQAGIKLFRIKCARKYNVSYFNEITSLLVDDIKNDGADIDTLPNDKCPRCNESTLERTIMGWPNKGKTFKSCSNCSYRTEPS
ncbi:DUF2726 domain-containing protein [Psychromonas sp. KJ10-2]|uniref:DUF2726 domain-containing protein n=1 Tax=Psychromonas sp. KJ10-2 TaxID=3391822 RepID=UPI0039B5546A